MFCERDAMPPDDGKQDCRPDCSAAVTKLERLTERLRQSLNQECPDITEPSRSCAAAFLELQQFVAASGWAEKDSSNGERKVLLNQLKILQERTDGCVQILRKTLAETEQKLTLLRRKKQATKGYRKCIHWV